ncbi:MAG: hypothetical protein M1831_002648 [Alyxoria varia]|nr:MAG: hypothetical protein M1831_002648 [Alyxoria varia]
MSPRSDNYLSLCLEQANKSPLHYRHGCVVVRGGKVIGQGFNDYRSGFDGGALKTGKVAPGGLAAPALLAPPSNSKSKRKCRQKLDRSVSQDASKIANPCRNNQTFTPFESAGGGSMVNSPFTMHSEMMAIHSALSTSAGGASPDYEATRSNPTSSVCAARRQSEFQRPAVRKVRARGAPPASSGFNSGTLNPVHLNQVFEQKSKDNKDDRKENVNNKDNRAGSMIRRGEFHVGQIGRNVQHQHAKEQHRNRCGFQTQDQYQWYQYEKDTRPCHRHNSKLTRSDHGAPASKDLRAAARTPKPGPQPILAPKGQTGQTTRDVKSRTKHPKLIGADLYVARVGCGKPNKPKSRKANRNRTLDLSTPPGSGESTSSSGCSTPSSPASVSPSPTSLHDELVNPHPRKKNTQETLLPSSTCSHDGSDHSIHASRPCYRCITYMQAVGIKRVFWTNAKGEWEGGKVRDLVDALESSYAGAAGKDVSACFPGARHNGVDDGDDGGNGAGASKNPAASSSAGLFVTKHEVLMMRRVMGNEAAKPSTNGVRGSGKKAGKGR